MPGTVYMTAWIDDDRMVKHVEGTDDICYDVLAAKAKKLY